MPQNLIYYVDSAAYGGTEQILLYLVSRLDRSRWRPILLYHPDPSIEPFLAEVRQLDVDTRAVPRMQGVRGIWKIPSLVRTIRRERPALFHAHLNWLLSCKFGLIAAWLARVPIRVATLQQFLLPPWKTNVYWQQRIISTTVHRYVAVAQAIADQLSESFGVPHRKIDVVHNGIPVERFSPERESDGSIGAERTTGSVVLTVGRLDDQKGHRFLLETVPEIPDVIFVFAGEGENRDELEQLARGMGVSDRVVFLGHRTDISDLLAGCDLFVLPSLYEAFPLSVLEAMAAGKPVVTTAVGGTPEAIVDGVTGYLVPPGDSIRLAEAIRTALADPDGSRAMGLAGQDRAALYSVSTMVDRYSRVYEGLVRGQSRPGETGRGFVEGNTRDGRWPGGS